MHAALRAREVLASKPAIAAHRATFKELREFIVESVSSTGGHFSSNLGTVELTIALHYKAGTTWHAEWVAATWAFIGSTAKASDAIAILASPAPLATLNTVAATYPHVPLADPSVAPVWCPIANEMWAATPPPDQPAPAYVVAKNGTAPTRPAFAFANGARSYSSFATAPVGAACDCSIKLIEGQLTFCQVAPATVAVCSKP